MSHTFAVHQKVKVVDDSGARGPIKALAREAELEVRDFMGVSPGDLAHCGHHQRLKVGVPGETWTSDWISGAWFEPL